MSRTRIAVALALAAPLTAQGCGSSTSGSKGGPAAGTPAAFIVEADAICRRSNEARRSIGRGKNPDYSKMAAYEQGALDELRRLKAPTPIAGNWRLILGQDAALVQDTRVFAEYIATYNKRGASAVLLAGNQLERKMEALARKTGFVDCTQFT